MCFRNPNLDQQHPLQAVLPNCPLAKNRNRTSRAWAWRGPHPLHIIVFSVRWPAKASNDKISKLSCKIQHGQNICTMKVCSTCAFEEKSFLIYWSLFIPPFCPCFWIHTFWCKISLVSSLLTTAMQVVYATFWLSVSYIFCNVIKIEGERHPRVTKYKTPF